MTPGNEGKACDAVIRRIEVRKGAARRNLCSPEREGHPAPIDSSCNIGDQLFAIEHTLVEPFERHIELEAKAKEHFEPIRSRVAGLLPATEHFELWLPVASTLDLKGRELARVQTEIADWVIRIADTLPIGSASGYALPIQGTTLFGVPFAVSLQRVSHSGFLGELSVKHIVPDSNKNDRLARIRRAYEKKVAQLSPWKKIEARTILVLEADDIQLTNAQRVADTLIRIEKDIGEKPDEIYLFSTAIPSPWWLWIIRIDDRDYYSFSVQG
jgi:hypothetical protein